MPLATKNLALIATLLAVAVSHVQPSTVILCPLQVDSVDVVGFIIRLMFGYQAGGAYRVRDCYDFELLYALFLTI